MVMHSSLEMTLGLEKGQEAAKLNQEFGRMFGNRSCLWQELWISIKELWSIAHLTTKGTSTTTLKTNRGVQEWIVDQWFSGKCSVKSNPSCVHRQSRHSWYGLDLIDHSFHNRLIVWQPKRLGFSAMPSRWIEERRGNCGPTALFGRVARKDYKWDLGDWGNPLRPWIQPLTLLVWIKKLKLLWWLV